MDHPNRRAPNLPPVVRLLALVLMVAGMLELLCLLVVGLTVSPHLALLLTMPALVAFGTTAGWVGLYYGQAWVVTAFKGCAALALVGAGLASVVPEYALMVSTPLTLAGMPLIVSAGYLGQRGIRASLEPPETANAGPVRRSIARAASMSRSIGGLALFVWGLAIAVFAAFACYQTLTSDDRWREVIAVAVVVTAGLYVTPCLAFGFVIWREPPSLVATLFGFALVLVAAGAVSAVWFVAAIPAAIAIALAIGLLAPTCTARAYSAFESK